jgi:K+-sensing histidine kinase KdpD
VRNSGSELDAETLESAFLPFAEERREAGAIEGLGVSRYVCKAMIDAPGGTISAGSGGANRGALFTVRLPRHAAQTA